MRPEDNPRVQAFIAGMVFAAGPKKALEILASLPDAELATFAEATS